MLFNCLTGHLEYEDDEIETIEAEAKVKASVNHPAHYQGEFECIDEMIALFGVNAVINFCACNVYKYRFRADAKGGKEDIAKAEWYMRKLMELNKEKEYDY